jgi:GNAT acetyltransferase-like protein
VLTSSEAVRDKSRSQPRTVGGFAASVDSPFVIEAFGFETAAELDALIVDGRPVAMGIVLRSRDRAFFWKIAMTRHLRRNRPAFSSRWKRRRSSKRTNPVGFAWRAVLRRRLVGWMRDRVPRAQPRRKAE